MFGSKLNAQSLRSMISNTKSHIGNAYGFTKNFLGNIDSTVRTMKDIYSIAQPVLEDVLGSKATATGNKYIQKGLSGYENIRSKVMDTDENVGKHYNTVVGGMQKKQIDIGL